MPVQSEFLKNINKGKLKLFCSCLNLPWANNSINQGGSLPRNQDVTQRSQRCMTTQKTAARETTWEGRVLSNFRHYFVL